MNTAALLIITLSNGGYWFGGQPQTVAVRWAVEGGLPPAEVLWRLAYGEVDLAGGRVALTGEGGAAGVVIEPPRVRARIALRLVCRAVRRERGAELATAEAVVHLFPEDETAPWSGWLEGRSVVVCDANGALAGELARAKVPFARVDDPSGLQLIRADVILVAEGQLRDSPFGQAALMGQARSGASVIIFRQTAVEHIAGYRVARRPLGRVRWRVGHPLLEGLRRSDVREWVGPGEDQFPIELTGEDPVVALAYSETEPGAAGSPLDALLAVTAVGKGRVVLCQLPLGKWGRDPRARLFLGNALRYLSTTAGPTLPRSGDKSAKRAAAPEVPAITIPAGVSP